MEPHRLAAYDRCPSGRGRGGTYVRKAVSALAVEGYIVTESGPRNAIVRRLVMPFRDVAIMARLRSSRLLCFGNGAIMSDHER